MKRLVTACLLVLVTAGVAARAAPLQDAPHHPLQWVAVVENRIWTDSEAEAQYVGAKIADAGYNAVRIFVPYSPGQAEIENDKLRLCNAATSARNNGLQLIVSLVGVGSDYVPIGWAKVDRLNKTVNDHMYELFQVETDEEGNERSVGCTTDVKEFNVEIFNEVNSERWWIDPDRYVRILSRVYPVAKAKAEELGVEVTIICGALTSNDDPLGYIHRMGEEMRRLGITTLPCDVFSFHPYPFNSSESPDTPHPAGNFVGLADHGLLRAALKEAFGYVPRIFLSEMSWESDIPKSQRWRYWGKVPPSSKPVSEPTQGKFYALALKRCTEQPKVIGCAIFHLFDDPQLEQWQSGQYYYSNQLDEAHPAVAKSSLADVRSAALAAQGP